MKSGVSWIVSGILLILVLLCAGCSSYSEPELACTLSADKVGANAENLTITYDVTVDISNTGSNNAYNVMVMALLSTPEDRPEYRFTTENIEVGTVPKGEKISVTRRISLPMTRDNYNAITGGQAAVHGKAKVMRMSSNIME